MSFHRFKIVQLACVGFLFGACFPLVSVLVERHFMHQGTGAFLDILIGNPIQQIVALAPFVFGAAFTWMGFKQYRLELELAKARAVREEHWRLAMEDSLTRLGNRHRFSSEIEKILARSSRHTAVLMIDLDRFKAINDTLGHSIGDQLLIALSQRIGKLIGAHDQVFRMGGDEFIVLVDVRLAPRRAEGLAKKIVESLSQPFILSQREVVAGCSIGITFVVSDDRGDEEILRRADLALYEAKSQTGSSYTVFRDEFSQAADKRQELEVDIRGALERDEFFLQFQPIIGVSSEKIRGFEALLRWNHPVHGLVAPDKFIPFAEQSGLISQIGERVLEMACQEAVSWPKPISVSVNVSAAELKNARYFEQVVEVLDKTGLPAGRLTLEITESLFLENMTVVSETITKLKRVGIRLALDDFGTGFSSINHLRSLDLDYLKLDRSFVHGVSTNADQLALVKNVIELGKLFKLTTTIEGVETADELEIMRNQGVDEAQGYHFSRPMDAQLIPEFLQAQSSSDVIRLAS
ncbi:MAG: EAL domain-containing protein [Ahrensia sp.]|nr:EAL domain-containing protein [Ahrensia sp.]